MCRKCRVYEAMPPWLKHLHGFVCAWPILTIASAAFGRVEIVETLLAGGAVAFVAFCVFATPYEERVR